MDGPDVVILLSNYSTILLVGGPPNSSLSLSPLFKQGSEYEEDLGDPLTAGEQVGGANLLGYNKLYLNNP